MKHPVMAGYEKEVQNTLQDPDEIRQSKTDPAVSKRLNGEGFLVTTYPTDTMKVGKKVWPK